MDTGPRVEVMGLGWPPAPTSFPRSQQQFIN